MKKTISIFLLMLATTLYSQEYSRITIEPSIGITKIQDITSYDFTNYNIGVRYMLNNKFGVRVTGTYTNSIENYFSANIQGVINVGRLLNFEDFTKRYSILLGVGGDYTYLNKSSLPEVFRNKSNNHLTASIDNLYKINTQTGLKKLVAI